MKTQYVYSITITKEKETIRFLKCFESQIKVDNELINTLNKPKVLIKGDESESYALVAIIQKENFSELYEELKKISKIYKLSVEYVKDSYVYILPYKQLHSGIDYKYNQLIIHNDVPKTRPYAKNEEDLRLRKAEPRDYGSGAEEEKDSNIGIKELLVSKEWLNRLYCRFTYLTHNYYYYCNGCNDYYTAKNLFLQAFVLTLNELHTKNETEIPELINHLTIFPTLDSSLTPVVTLIGKTRVNPESEQYLIYVAPTFEGRALILAPNNTFYARENSKEITELFWYMIKEYSKYYPVP